MANAPVEVVRQTPPTKPVPDAWRSLHAKMDRSFDRFCSGFGMQPLRRMFDTALTLRTEFTVPTPAVDITEDAAGYKVTAETEKKDANTYLSERCYGAFQRSFVVPEGVDGDQIRADFAKGVLTVLLPKAAPAQKRTIEVKKAA